MALNGSTSSHIVQLAQRISASVATVDYGLTEKGLQTPSFDEKAPDGILPDDVIDTLELTAVGTEQQLCFATRPSLAMELRA